MSNDTGIPVRALCERCRNPRTVHENGLGQCSAPGCHAGPARAPCPEFVYGGQTVRSGKPWPAGNNDRTGEEHMSENYDISESQLRLRLAMAGQPVQLDIADSIMPADPERRYEMLRTYVTAAVTGQRTRITENGRLIAMIMPPVRNSGPDRFSATVYGDSYPALIEAAEAEARGFYGPDALLAVERVGTIHNAFGNRRGQYNTEVIIRCTSLPEGWNVP